ncbi:MAG: peptidoglycan DD-metalloendopeptidase family protein, partial [Tannerella sp.]|nr:peptidoglycan DD-metalloendopeptidase family protein [Tannerella sp.]
MNIHSRCKIALICFGLVAVLYANAEGPKKKIPAQTSAETALRLDKQASELMASRVTSSKVASDELAIAKLDEYNRHLEEENLLFPADELYNSNWDTLHVNPFQNLKIDYPDSYTIDCSLFVMPIDNNVKVTSKYGPRRRRMHRGIDLDLDTGDTVRAAFGGKVRIKSFERGGYGYYLVLRHPNGLETVYGHLSKFIARENQIVHAGQAIGLGGNTGNSRGSHLHFETRFLGKDINPAELIDFANGVPHNNKFEFHNVKINGKKSNVYSTSEDAVVVHRVRKGDNLGKIAIQYGTTVSELCRLNGISKTSMLSIGQPIRIIAKQIKVEASP